MNITLAVDSQKGRTVIRLFKDRQSPTSNKEFTLEVSLENETITSIVPALEIQDVLGKFKLGKISPFSHGPVGFDGTSYELSLGDWPTSATYKWWESPGEGWEVLSEIAGSLLNLAQRHTNRYLPQE